MMKRNRTDNSTRRDLAGDGGFMLLEVMASVAILGLAIVAVIQLFAGGLRLARTSDDYTDMVLLAREKMAEALLNKPIEEGTVSGRTGEGAVWTVDVGGYEERGSEAADSGAYKTYSVAVRVAGQGKRGTGYTLMTLKTVVQ